MYEEGRQGKTQGWMWGRRGQAKEKAAKEWFKIADGESDGWELITGLINVRRRQEEEERKWARRENEGMVRCKKLTKKRMKEGLKR